MERFVTFLRGINVGGKNKVSMTILKKAFEDKGFSNVVTYINSGNVIFSSDILDIKKLIKIIEEAILSTFKLDISVVVLTVEELFYTYKNAPKWWNNDNKDIKDNALFIIPPAKSEDILKDFGEIKPEFEKVTYYKNTIFWSYDFMNHSKTRWSRIVGTQPYKLVTIRNANTVRKILELENRIDK